MPASGAASAEQDQEIAEGRAGLDRGDGERAENADPDKGRDAADARRSRQWRSRRAHGLMIRTGAEGRRRSRPRAAAAAIAVGRRSGADIARLAAGPPLARLGELASTRSTSSLALLGLRAHQPAIGAVAADQLGVPAALDDPAVVEHQDAVGADDARQPVRQDQGRAALPTGGRSPAGSPPRSRHRPRRAPRRGSGSARRAAGRGRWPGAGAGRRTD